MYCRIPAFVLYLLGFFWGGGAVLLSEKPAEHEHKNDVSAVLDLDGAHDFNKLFSHQLKKWLTY